MTDMWWIGETSIYLPVQQTNGRGSTQTYLRTNRGEGISHPMGGLLWHTTLSTLGRRSLVYGTHLITYHPHTGCGIPVDTHLPPQLNGQVECFNRTILEGLRRNLDDHPKFWNCTRTRSLTRTTHRCNASRIARSLSWFYLESCINWR